MGAYFRPEKNKTRKHKTIRHALIAGLGFFILAWGGVELTREAGRTASIWPATAFALAFLLRAPRKEWPAILTAIFGGSVMAYVAHNDSLSRTIFVSFINLPEVLLGAHVLRRYTKEKFDLSDHKHLLAFAAVSLLLPIPFSLLAAAYFTVFMNLSYGDVAISWYMANALGIIIFTPLFFIIGWDQLKSFTRPDLRKKSFIVLTGLVVSLSLVFMQNSYPLLFVVFPIMALTAFWLGTPGAVIALAITTVMSIICAMSGIGPISLVDGSMGEKTFVLQGFLATTALISLPIASALTYRTRLEKSLKEAKESADKANLAKSVFLTSMSHELRTPLNAILGFSQLLLLNQGQNLTEKNKEHLEHVMTGGEHLLKLVSDVLDLAKVEAGKVSINPVVVSCDEVFEEVAEMLGTTAAKHNITIHVEAPMHLYVMADRARLTQVMVNLLSNAVKYNTDGGKVFISAKAVDTGVRIEVLDTGKGIPCAKHDQIFQPFNRLGAERSEIEGSGIGLAISKQLTEAMKGYMGFESEEGKGSIFYIELPQAEAQEPVINLKPEISSHVKSKSRILYIEDNFANAELMRSIVGQFLKVELFVASAGHEGLQQAKDFAPDIIISDIHLSDMTGYEVLATLKADPETAHIPVFALTADATFPQNEHAKGFDRVITKPFQLKDLVDHIGSVLQAA